MLILWHNYHHCDGLTVENVPDFTKVLPNSQEFTTDLNNILLCYWNLIICPQCKQPSFKKILSRTSCKSPFTFASIFNFSISKKIFRLYCWWCLWTFPCHLEEPEGYLKQQSLGRQPPKHAPLDTYSAHQNNIFQTVYFSKILVL